MDPVLMMLVGPVLILLKSVLLSGSSYDPRSMNVDESTYEETCAADRSPNSRWL